MVSSDRTAWSLILLALFVAPCQRSTSLGTPDPSSTAKVSVVQVAYEPAKTKAAHVTAIAARLSSRLPSREGQQVGRAIAAACAEYDIAMEFAMAVIEVESSYNPFAISHAGALGLMQVMPRTGAEVARRIGIPWQGTRTLFDPASNVRIGLAYLRQLIDRYRNVRVALAAYNWGPGRVDRRLRKGGAIPALYANRVLAAYSRSSRRFLGS